MIVLGGVATVFLIVGILFLVWGMTEDRRLLYTYKLEDESEEGQRKSGIRARRGLACLLPAILMFQLMWVWDSYT